MTGQFDTYGSFLVAVSLIISALVIGEANESSSERCPAPMDGTVGIEAPGDGP